MRAQVLTHTALNWISGPQRSLQPSQKECFYLIWRCKRRLHPLHGRLAPASYTILPILISILRLKVANISSSSNTNLRSLMSKSSLSTFESRNFYSTYFYQDERGLPGTLITETSSVPPLSVVSLITLSSLFLFSFIHRNTKHSSDVAWN
jgi:hypothetical protein